LKKQPSNIGDKESSPKQVFRIIPEQCRDKTKTDIADGESSKSIKEVSVV